MTTRASPLSAAGASLAARFATLSVPGLTADYARLPPGQGPSRTAGQAVGVAFTPQRRALWQVGGGGYRGGPLAPGAVFVVPAEGLDWVEWTDVSESVEMWVDPGWLGELSELHGGPARVAFDYHELGNDPVVVNVASLLRRSLLQDDPPRAALEAIPLFLAAHVLERYQGIRIRPPGRIRKLEQKVLAGVADYIEAHLGHSLSLADLAGIAGRSQYHFLKAFKAATGSPPYAFIAARRMERALVLLQQTALPVRQVARLVGFESLTHFRKAFRRAWGEPTSTYRRTGRPRRAA